MKIKNIWLVLILALTITACSDDKDKDKDGDGKAELTSQLYQNFSSIINTQNQGLIVVDEQQQPIAGASVLLGSEIDNPFKDNLLITNQDGEVTIPKNWSSPLPVTVEAPGYIRMTYQNVQPSAQILQVHQVEAQNFIEIKGQTIDYGRLRQDNFIDFALIIPAFTQRSMINFDVSSVISPVTDTISVAGQKIDLPSNISLPKQRESYIIPITFEKPEFRSFVRNPGFYKMFATHGRFPFRDVVDDFRSGKSVFEVINKFDFLGGGQRDLQINKSIANQDISIRQVAFDQTIEVHAPNFKPNLEMLSLAMVNQGGYFYPADLKRIQPSQTMVLKYPASQTDSYVLSALVDKNAVPVNVIPELGVLSPEDTIDLRTLFMFPIESIFPLAKKSQPSAGLSLTLSFEKAETTDPVSFIEFVDPPQVSADKLVLDVPQILGDISPVSTYVTLSEVEVLGTGRVKTEKKTRMWEFLAGGWQAEVHIPKLNVDFDPNKSYRWEVLFLGRKGSSLSGGLLLDGITHVTRSSYNF